MKQILVEAYSVASNFAIVKLPQRQFPGMVIQGDSLAILVARADAIRSLALKIGDESLIAEAKELFEDLRERQTFYERILGENGIGLPYVKQGAIPPEADGQ